ncbi:POTRA domain-containing protein, partial [Gemmatimonadota bacterium]
MKGGAALLLALALLSFPPWGHMGLGAQADLQEVSRLRFRGNVQFPDEVLTNSIITRETECRSPVLTVFCWAGADFSLDPYFFNDRVFRMDAARVRLFYYQHGFREAVVDTVLDRSQEDEILITFNIQEGDPVRITQLSFTGLEELGDSSILEDFPIQVGDPLSATVLSAARDTLLNRLRNDGFAYADVLQGSFIPRGTYDAQVSFDLFPGSPVSFGPLTVTGNRLVSELVVRRMLPFREGDPYGGDLRFTGPG